MGTETQKEMSLAFACSICLGVELCGFIFSGSLFGSSHKMAQKVGEDQSNPDGMGDLSEWKLLLFPHQPQK